MAESIKIHEIGKTGKSISGEIRYTFARQDIEGKTAEQVRQLIVREILKVGELLFSIAMRKQHDWEKETEDLKKFLGKSH